MTSYLVVCGVLALLIAALGFGFRRLFARTLKAKAARRSLQVLDLLPLGGKHRLAVVRCYDRSFLIGMGEKETRLIAELDPGGAHGAPPEPNAIGKTTGEFLRTLRHEQRRAELIPEATPARQPSGLGGGILG